MNINKLSNHILIAVRSRSRSRSNDSSKNDNKNKDEMNENKENDNSYGKYSFEINIKIYLISCNYLVRIKVQCMILYSIIKHFIFNNIIEIIYFILTS